MRKDVSADIEKRDKLSVQLRDAELAVQKARRALDDVRAQRLAVEARLRELEKEEAGLEKELAASVLRWRANCGRLRQWPRGGTEAPPEPGGPRDLRPDAEVLRLLRPCARERIAGIRDKLEHLALVEDKIAAEHDRLAALEADQERQVEALRSAQQGRTRTVAAIDREIKSQSSQLKRLQSQAQSLEKLIADLRKALENVPVAKQAPFEPLRGKLPWPVQQGHVLARFGQPRAGGSMRWQGMLIGTDRGARVRAPFAGQVVYADWLPGMGLMVVLNHGGGYLSLYGHNEEVFRKVGDSVSAGDVIGAVGNTGGREEPALYFEVRRGREPVDPRSGSGSAESRDAGPSPGRRRT